MNALAMKVMKEVGVDISEQSSKSTEDLPQDVAMDFVITVCSDAQESCPFFPGGKVIHRGFDDPPRLTKGLRSEEDILEVYRRVRDEIKGMVTEIESVLDTQQEGQRDGTV